jgi:glutamine amidotransferase
MRLGIVDYGTGNLRSVYNAFCQAGADPEYVSDADSLGDYDRLVLPGVGAAEPALHRLRQSGIAAALRETIIAKGHPLLAICLGMQMLAEKLTEKGEHEGLGWISGTVSRIEAPENKSLPVPHMGWNRLALSEGMQPDAAFIRPDSEFYFAHSYALRHTATENIAATTEYGGPFVSAIRKDTFFATQFHPEKSQRAGLALIEAFLGWKP